MRTNGENSIQVIENLIDDLLVVPPLFTIPKEGWVKWATSLAGTGPVGENTISGSLIRDTGPSWAYGLLLPFILTGEFEAKNLAAAKTPELLALSKAVKSANSIQELEAAIASMIEQTINIEEVRPVYWAALAKVSRMAFEDGQTLYIGVHRSIERYKSFHPVMRYLGGGQYEVDLEKPQRFKASDHKDALYKARQWFIKRREDEIQRMKDHAGEMARKLPRMILETTYAALAQDEVLYDNEGFRLAWKRHAHGLYGVQGYDWCYIMSCSVEKAAQMALLAQIEANQMGQSVQINFNFRADLKNKPIFRYYNIRDFSPDLNGNIRWEGGEYQRKKTAPDGEMGVVVVDGKPLFGVVLKQTVHRDGEVLLDEFWTIKVVGGDRSVWVSSPTPPSWRVSREEALAWAIRHGLNEVKKRSQKK